MKTFIRPKPDEYSKTFRILLLLLDVFAVTAAFYILSQVYPEALADSSKFYTFGLGWLLLWISVSIFASVYEVRQQKKLNRILSNTLKVAVIHLPFAGGIAYLFGITDLTLSLLLSIYGILIATELTIKGTLLLLYQYIRSRKSNKKTFVIAGFTPAGQDLYRYFTKEKSYSYHFAGFFDSHKTHPLVAGDMTELKKFCVREEVNEIFFALPYDKEMVRDLSAFADDNFIRFGVLQDIGSCEVETHDAVLYHDNLPVLPVRSRSSRENTGKSYHKALNIIKSWNL